jgi:tetratricopeptide (TPR) repeat protein
VGLYVNTLGHDFVFDDVTLILQNPSVRSLDWFSIIYWDGYRPVRTLTYGLNYAIGGEDPFGYHLVNIVLHGLNVLLVYSLVLLLGRSNLAAGSAGLLFAIHPVQSAAVAYISGRKDLLAAFFVLLGLNLYLRSRNGESWKLAIAFACFLMALLSKEVAIVFPFMLLSVDALREWNQQSDGRPSIFQAVISAVRRQPWLYGAFTLLAALALFGAIFINRASRMEGFWGGSLPAHLGTSFKLFVHYLKMIVYPHPLIADYTGGVFPISAGFLEPATIFAVFVVVAYIGFSLWVFRRNAYLSVGLLWIPVALAPVLQLIPFHEIAADHFLYLPLVGASLVGGVGVSALATRVRRKWIGAILAMAVIGCSARVLVRNGDWKNRNTLWEATYKSAPDSYRANVNLGLAYYREGRSEEGLRLTLRAAELDPQQPIPLSNLGGFYLTEGMSLRQEGKLDEAKLLQERAIQYFSSAIELDPENPFSLSNVASCYKELGLIFEEKGLPDKALEARMKARDFFEKSLSLPDRRREVKVIWRNYALLLIDAEELGSWVYPMVTQRLSNFLAEFPDDPGGNYWMGYSLTKMAEYEKAISYLQRSVRLDPQVETWDLLATCYEALGETQKTLAAYQQALGLSPDSAQIHYNLGVLFQRIGESGKAIHHFREALRLDRSGEYTTLIEAHIANLHR